MTLATALAEGIRTLPVSSLIPADDNPRRDVGDVTELAESIASLGLLEPLVVTPATYVGDPATGRESASYLVVCGHRRLAAAKMAKVEEVACVVRTMTPAQRLEAMLVENLQRADISPLEEAEAYHRLIGEYGIGQRELAGRVGKSQGHISKRVALLKLPDKARDLVDSGGITLEVATKLAAIEDPKVVDKLVKGGLANAYELEREVHAQDRRHMREKTRKFLEGKGVPVFHEETGAYSWYLAAGAKVMPLSDGGYRGYSSLLQLTVAEHATEPCHAAVVDFDGKAVYVCTHPKAHPGALPKPERDPGGFKETKEQKRRRLAREKEREEHDRREKELEAARQSMLAGAMPPVSEVLDLMILCGLSRVDMEEGSEGACALLEAIGVETEDLLEESDLEKFQATALARVDRLKEGRRRLGLAIAFESVPVNDHNVEAFLRRYGYLGGVPAPDAPDPEADAEALKAVARTTRRQKLDDQLADATDVPEQEELAV